MTTLADAMLAVARTVEPVIESTATGGSATTLVDSKLGHPNDYFDNGCMFILSGAAAGKSRLITDWVLGSKTFSFATLTQAVVAGDRYAATPASCPQYALALAVNNALLKINNLPAVYEDAGLVTVADQQEYSLPAGVHDLLRVEIAGEQSEPYEWRRHMLWRESGGKLRFDDGQYEDQPAGYRIRLTYRTRHVALAADTDTISDLVHPEWLRWAGAAEYLRRRTMIDKDNNDLKARLNEALLKEAQAAAAYGMYPRMVKDAHLAGW
jgi:hypothetical protein